MKNFFMFKKEGRQGFELKVTAGNLSDHQKRLIVTSIGDNEHLQLKGCLLENEQTATCFGLAALIKSAGYIHSAAEIEEVALQLQKMLQERWERHLEDCRK